jgi:hypothetical protein
MVNAGCRHGSGHGTGSHPTVGKHMFRGELMVWIHGMILLDTIYMVTNDIKNKGSISKLLLGMLMALYSIWSIII